MREKLDLKGTLVEFIDDDFSGISYMNIYQKLPKKNRIYTIRKAIDYSEHNFVGILLEEIVNEKVFLNNRYYEPRFNLNRFKIIPDSILK